MLMSRTSHYLTNTNMEKRRIFAGEIYHIYNRGNQKMKLFRKPSDYKKFIRRIHEYSKKFSVHIFTYCLMPNHFHLLLKEPFRKSSKWSNISHFLHLLQTSYAKYFCHINRNYSGHVFQGTYKIKHVKNDEYFLTLQHYIYTNPVRKKLVVSPEDWPWTLRVDPKGRGR